MNLNDLLTSYPHITLAIPEDNEDILNYYHSTKLSAKESDVIYKRGNDFFQFLKERSEKFLVFILKDEDLKLQGVAVASYRTGFINGELQTIGYLGDLRVSLNRKLIREWRKFYGEFLEKSPLLIETGHCRYYQTVLMSNNSLSKSNLADTKIPHLYYKELARYQMVNIIGRIKFKSQLSKYKIESTTPGEVEALKVFLTMDHRRRMFGHDWSKEFSFRLSSWNDFKLSDWIIVKNDQGTLLAATCFWNPIKTKQIIVPHIPIIFKIIAKLSHFIPGVSIKPLPKSGEPIQILYLNQVSFAPGLNDQEEKEILRAIIDHAFKRDFNMLAYCDFEREGLLKKMKGLITQKNEMKFFSVHYKDNEGNIRDNLSLSEDMPTVAFDMSLV